MDLSHHCRYPILFFILMLTVFKLKGYVAGALSILVAGIVAVFVYKMPFVFALMSALYGALAGIWPIASMQS